MYFQPLNNIMATNTVKPLTLTIIPPRSVKDPGQGALAPSPNFVQANAGHSIAGFEVTGGGIYVPQVAPTVNIPTFQYNPITPIILQPKVIVPTIITQIKEHSQVPVPSPISGINMGRQLLPRNATEEEKVEHVKKLNREKQKRFREKTKGFLDVARLHTIDERIKHVVLLSYPHIYNQLPEEELNQHIRSFVINLFPTINPN